MEYDPSQFSGTAPYYLRGRPPYSADLGRVLAEELGLDGTGTLVDVGAGPGTLAAQLAPLVDRVVVVEPDAGMLAEARRHLAASRVEHADLVAATAEQLPRLGVAPVRLVTFGQSFHRVDRLPVAEACTTCSSRAAPWCWSPTTTCGRRAGRCPASRRSRTRRSAS
jgi:hypothetical protein